MATDTNRDVAPTRITEMDQTSQKGWEFFTKFLLANVVVTIVVLLVVGLLTVWS
jgi:hypothetical protein